jgi:hypothetical protein
LKMSGGQGCVGAHRLGITLLEGDILL